VTLKSRFRVTQDHRNGTIGQIIHDLLLVELFDVEYYRDLEMSVRGHSRSLKMVPFESLGMVSYSPSIVAMAVSVAVCEIFSVKEWCDLKNGLGSVQGHWKWHHLIDLIRFRISALAARTSRGRSVCSRSPAARPRHSRTPDTSLAAMQCVNASRTSYAY